MLTWDVPDAEGLAEGNEKEGQNSRRADWIQWSLWDIHLSLAIMPGHRSPLPPTLSSVGEWTAGGSWSLKHMKCGQREQGTSRTRVATDWEVNVTLPAAFRDLAPSTSMGHTSGVLLMECKWWSPNYTKGTFATTSEAFQEGGVHHKG